MWLAPMQRKFVDAMAHKMCFGQQRHLQHRDCTMMLAASQHFSCFLALLLSCSVGLACVSWEVFHTAAVLLQVHIGLAAY